MAARKIAVFLVSLCCAVGIAATALRAAARVPQNRDEISWYFHTEFFSEAFLSHRYFSNLWYGYESFDHPQVSKYIYGASLYLQDPSYMKERDALVHKYGRWSFYRNIPSDPVVHTLEFGHIISYLRRLNAGTLMLLLGGLFAMAYAVTSSLWLSFLYTYALAANPVFIASVMPVTSDIHMLLSGVFASIFYIRSFQGNRRGYIFGAAVFSALSVGAKLNGIFFVYSVILTELTSMLSDRKNSISIKRLAVYASVCAGVWLMINPALYRSPIAESLRYFTFRSQQSEIIARYVQTVALHGPGDSAVAAACTLVLRNCDIPHSAGGAMTVYDTLNILLFAGALIYAVRAFFRNRKDIIFLFFVFGSTVSYYIFFLSNYAPKYYLPAQVALFLIELAAVIALVRRVVFRMKQLYPVHHRNKAFG